MKNKDFILSSRYDDIALEFDEVITLNDVNVVALRGMIDLPLNNKRVLDMGCGQGDDLVFYEENGADAYGIDQSREMIETAKLRIDSSKVSVGDFSKTKYKKDFFDEVMSKYAFAHYENIDEIYTEVVRVLKENGTFTFLVTHPGRQQIERKPNVNNVMDYFEKGIIETPILDGSIIVSEYSHTLKDYLSEYFLDNFDVIGMDEQYDPAAANVKGWRYPGFLIIKAKKRKGSTKNNI